MQTVNFQCGHCGQLMGVGVEFLGQQHRCPHCQQVVVAPAATPAPAPEGESPTEDPFANLAFERHDDIFSQHSETEDALFAQPDGPRLEMPREESLPAPAAVPPPLPAPVEGPAPVQDLPLETTSPPVPEAGEHPEVSAQNGAPTLSYLPPGEGQDRSLTAPAESLPPWLPAESSPETSSGEGALPPPTISMPREDSTRVNWFVPLVFIPLVLYALIATAAAGFLYLRIQAEGRVRPDIWEQMPDVDGDVTGIRFKSKAGGVLKFNRQKATTPLPERLRVKLRETLQIGDLEVTPTTVERKRVKVFVETYEKPEPCGHDSLVLTLEMRNLSDEYAFTPLDNYFDRHWDGKGEQAPLTVLVAGPAQFFGGPARWYPLKRDRGKRQFRQWVNLEGRKDVDREGLAPGASGVYQVCTDGGDQSVMTRLFGVRPYQGKMLWRVQVRRGLIEHKGRRLPAAAVIGVEFTAKQIDG
jgi:hypothetical protein